MDLAPPTRISPIGLVRSQCIGGRSNLPRSSADSKHTFDNAIPAKPICYGRLDDVIAQLNELPGPWIDHATLQSLVKVGRRRAQQILQPCVTRKIGASGVAGREVLIAHLQHRAQAQYERKRRQRLAATLAESRVLVEVPITVLNQQFANLPEGVVMSSGNISITFFSAAEALQPLLALAMAIGNEYPECERSVGLESNQSQGSN